MIRRPVLFDLGGDGGEEPRTSSDEPKTPEAETEASDASADAARREEEARKEAERAAAERDRADREKAERDKADREKAERERVEREKVARDRAEQERLAREEAARDRAARAEAERQRAARETAEREEAERQRVAREQADRARVERERAERDRQARDRAAQERDAREKAERERAETDRLEREGKARQKVERDSMTRETASGGPTEKPARSGAAPRGRAPHVFITDNAGSSEPPVTPDNAPPVPDLDDGDLPPRGQAMQTLAALAARRPSRLAQFFWSSLTALLGFMISVAIWDFVTSLLTRNSLIGMVALIVVGGFLLAVLLVVLRELAAFGRLRRLDTLHKEADEAIASHDLSKAREVLDHLLRFYGNRDETRWGRQKLEERREEVLDADALLALTERELLTPLDTAATREVEAAARSVAMITALVPITLADLIAALTANLRMIRRIAEIYGGRGGVLGSLRLARSVLTHLVATGAVAVGDDMLGSVAGGGVLARVSRRFGEGVVNGALTARVGVAAMEVCRPLPFREVKRPSVSALVKRALAGLFNKGES